MLKSPATTSNKSKASRALRLPTYRQRTGYDKAIVTLTDARSGRRQDYWLGEYGSPASREVYNRTIAAWLTNDRLLPPPILHGPINGDSRTGDSPAITVGELTLAYWKHAATYYDGRTLAHLRGVIRITRQLFGSCPAVTFGPKSLRLIRESMIRGDANADPPRKPWSRKYINSQVHRLCRMFQWAASHEMVPAAVHQQLKSMPALRRGKTTAIDTDPVKPVPIEQVDAIRPFLSRQVEALVDLQLLTGARSGELLLLRPQDIVKDQKRGIWSVSLSEHKTAHHGHLRTIHMGPRAQKVLKPYLAGRSPTAFLFSPAEADAEWREQRSQARRTPLSCGNTTGTNRVESRRKQPGAHYSPGSYRRAIQRACDRAFPVPGGMSLEQARAWRLEHRWHPHQLRHTAATMIRQQFGLEAAQIALGHSSALVTDAVYAERDMDKVVEIMKKIG